VIPASTTTIGLEAFSGCSALTSFSVHPDNPNFKSVDGILFTKSGLSLFAFPSGLSGAFSIPAGVTHITVSAFRYSGSLTSVTLPSSITNVGENAFANCPQLTQATFSGNAPTSFGVTAFQAAAPGFTVFFNPGAINFTTPFWQTYPTQMLAVEDPYLQWLQANGLPLNSALGDDSNGDGVSLLMAYALDLDPDQNLAGSLPQPVISGNQMSISFHAGSPGVSYIVETCTDVSNWTTQGVTLSPPDSNQIRTASVTMTGGSRFMRLLAIY
jgi:BspA type Leucine rich repeat region (6 copies)